MSESIATETIVNNNETNAVEELVEFLLVFNKERFNIKFDLNKRVSDLKVHVQTLSGKYLANPISS